MFVEMMAEWQVMETNMATGFSDLHWE